MAKGRLLTTLIILIAVSFYMYESQKSTTSTTETRISQKTTQLDEIPLLPTSIDTPEITNESEPEQKTTVDLKQLEPEKPTVQPQKPVEQKQPKPEKQTVKQTPSAQPVATIVETTVQIPQKKKVLVKNNITKKMLGYKHWSGTYRPSIFVLKVNGTQIDQGEEKSIEVTDGTLNVRYDYSFMNGYRKEAKNETFELEKETDAANITFSWKGKWHVIIDTAKPQSAERVEFGV